MTYFAKYIATAALSAGALIGTLGTGNAYNGDFSRYSDPHYGGYAFAPGPDYGYGSYAYAPAPGYGYYAYAPGPGYGFAYYNPWSRSRSLNHGQGPGCIQSPASYEYTSCD